MTDTPVIIRKTRQPVSQTERKVAFTPNLESGSTQANDFRVKAWKAFNELPFPSSKDEPWRRTDISNLPLELFKLAEQSAGDQSTIPQDLLEPLADGEHGGEIIIENGRVTVHLDEELKKQGLIFTDMQTAWKDHAELIGKVTGSLVDPKEDKFAALSFAMLQNGVFLYVPRDVKVSSPLHSLIWVSGEGMAHFSNVTILLDEGAEVTYVHESASDSHDTRDSMHAGVMEIKVGDGASLRFVELQSWGENMWNFSHERVDVARDGNVEWIFGALGSKMTKNFSDLNLVGQGATGKMSGFYFTHGKQHLDHDTQQNHLAPNTTSDLLFKGALVGESRSVWQGMIHVAENATKTDGYQANRNLILDQRARADSIPGLEILTDDVRCTHGATVGKIDPEELFYLESRGMPREDAERLIVEGFFDPIMQRIPFDGVRDRFQKAIIQKLEGTRV